MYVITLQSREKKKNTNEDVLHMAAERMPFGRVFGL